MNLRQYQHVRPGLVRFWAWPDLVFGLALALPPLAYGFAKLIFTVYHQFGGTADLPDFAPIQWLVVFVCGVFILNWGVVRLLYPTGVFALIDGFLKFWIGGLMVYVIVVMGAPEIFWVFVIYGAIGAVMQLVAVFFRTRSSL
ncbi:MAG: hypothetical protein ACRESS_05750 [Stenotrophobium sp.]